MSTECEIYNFHKNCQSIKNICLKCKYIIEFFLLLENYKQFDNNYSDIMIIADFKSIYYKRFQDEYILISFYMFQEICWYKIYSIKYKFDKKIFWQKFMKFILINMKSTLQKYIY